MAVDRPQHTGTNSIVESEPLTGLSLTSDATTNGNTSKKSIALAEADPNSVSNVDSTAFVNTKSQSAADPKKVSIVELNEEASGVDENLEVALPEGEDHEDRLDDDIGGANMQMDIGGKKKKSKKKKPKSQRGLVRSHSIVKEILANAVLVRRTIQQASRSTTLILLPHRLSMKKRKACMMCE